MRMRALLALLVLAGMLPVLGGVGANTGRADSSPIFLFLDTGGGSNNLSLAAPSSIGSVILGRNMTVNFTVSNFSGLLGVGFQWYVLNLSLVSLNMSGMKLSCNLQLDYYGNGSLVKVLPFQNYTTSTSMQTEHAIMGEVAGTDHDLYQNDLRRGSLRLELTRIDDSDGLLEILCGSGEDQSCLLTPYRAPLLADAGPDRSVLTNRTLPFNISLSRSVDPAGTLYLWNFGNGMTGAGDQVSVIYNRAGNYTVTLTLRWNGLERTDTALVTVLDNRPPVADAGLNLTKHIGENITFRGGGTDPDGFIVSYAWAFGDGFNATGQNVTHSYGTPGDYNVVLTVRDNDGAEGQDGLRVHVNHPPRITNITAARFGNQVNFQVVANDPDGTQLRYFWDFGDGTNGTGAQPVHRYLVSGTFSARCNVTDDYGDNASTTVNVTVANSAPRITNIGIASSVSTVGDPVHFTSSASDADGDTLTFLWDFGDGTTSQDQNPTHFYTRTGTYQVTLKVSDGISQDRRTNEVQVNEAAGPPLDSASWAAIGCIVFFLVAAILIGARASAAARKRQMEGGQTGSYGGTDPQPYGGGQPQRYGGVQNQPYGGTQPQPYGGAGHPQYGGQYPQYGAMYQPPQPSRPPRAPKAPPGVCPRCGSTDHQRFPDGHTKCNNCKKIFFTG